MDHLAAMRTSASRKGRSQQCLVPPQNGVTGEYRRRVAIPGRPAAVPPSE
jgi:hypothetical protein